MPKTDEKPRLKAKTIVIDEQLWADFGAACKKQLKKIRDVHPQILQDWIDKQPK